MLHQDAIAPEASPPDTNKAWSRTDKVLFAGLVASMLIQGVSMGFVAANMQANGKIGNSESDTVLIIIGALQAVQLMLNVLIGAASLNLQAVWGAQAEPSNAFAPAQASSASRRASLVGAIALFFMSVLMFTGLYSLALVFDSKSFSHLIIASTPTSTSSVSDSAAISSVDGVAPLDQAAGDSDSSSAASVGVSTVFAIVFFSVETQSLVGLGDVVPTTVATELIALAQQVVGVCFSVFIIAQVLPVFGKDAETAAKREEDEIKRKRRLHERNHAMRRFQHHQRHRKAQLRAAQLEESAAISRSKQPPPSTSKQTTGLLMVRDKEDTTASDDGKASPLRARQDIVDTADLEEMIEAGSKLDLQDVDDLGESSSLLSGPGMRSAVSDIGEIGLNESVSMQNRLTLGAPIGQNRRRRRRRQGREDGGLVVGDDITSFESHKTTQNWQRQDGESAATGNDDDEDDSDTASVWSESSGFTDMTGTDDISDSEDDDGDDMSSSVGDNSLGAGLGQSNAPGSSVRSEWSMAASDTPETVTSSPPSPSSAALSPVRLHLSRETHLLSTTTNASGQRRPRRSTDLSSSSHHRGRWESVEISDDITQNRGWCYILSACWSAVTHDGTVTTLRRWARRRLVLLSVALQLMIGAVLAADPRFEDVLEGRKGLTEVSVLWGAVVLQALQVGVIVFTSVKFVARAWSVTVLVLLQAYVALILAYAGIYLLLFFLGNDEQAFSIPQRAWEDPNGGEEPVQSSSALLALAFEFVYFAFAVQTSVGFGDVAPQVWYARVACVSHILISLVFNSIVLGYGLAHIGQAARRREEVKQALIRGRNLTTDLADFEQPTATEQRHMARAAGTAVQIVPPSPKRLGMGVLRRPTARRLSTGDIRELAPELGGSHGGGGGARAARKLRAI